MSAGALFAMVTEDHGRQQDAPARLEVGNVLARLDHFAGNVTAEDVRQCYPAQPAAYPEIKMVQGACTYTNQDMVLAQNRIGSVFILENFRTSELMNANCFHRAIPRSHCSIARQLRR